MPPAVGKNRLRASVPSGCSPGGQFDALLCQPVDELVKGEHTVHLTVLLRLVLLGDAGADEYHGAARYPLLDALGMGEHGRIHLCQIGQSLGIALLDQQIDAVAAGGDDELVFSRGDHALIFGLDDPGAPGSLLHIGKAQFEERLTHAVQTAHAEVGNKGGRQADNHRTARGDQSPGLIGILADLLGALGAGDIAVSAVDTLPLDNLCPVFGKPGWISARIPGCIYNSFYNPLF